MGMKYNNGKAQWLSTFAGADVVAEMEMASNATALYFPRVSSCTVVVVRGANGVVGCHLTIADSAELAERLFAQVAAEAGMISRMYFLGHLTTTGGGWGSEERFKWPRMAETVQDIMDAPGAIMNCFLLPPNYSADFKAEHAGLGLNVYMVEQNGELDKNADWVLSHCAQIARQYV